MEALERVCTLPREWRTNKEIEIMAADVAINIYQKYVKCNITAMETVESNVEEYEFMSETGVLEWVLSLFLKNLCGTQRKKFRKQFNASFPHHFILERRNLFAKHYVKKNFWFVNGYLASSNERTGGNYFNINLFVRIEEIYPEW